ncbi:hypothetical protein KFL_003510150 [Klebsormidium nitens]|uniref:Uncharacterized protein n=1 Tax=Klebsormidium nitens TaxID=105231 RepID=A0A1Y1IE95_KLENI|nr:hypothetical protein KFL_003510150 [Klebsormidium nitens]|eukprot:GAQ87421.1 hypothetical protein KFL_003510150 [Klebsormidium nitens]
MSVFLKNRCIRLNYLAEDLNTFAQQKVRELGENPTATQVAAVEREVLRCFQEKKVKAEEVLAKHPEWLREKNRGQFYNPATNYYQNIGPGQQGAGRPPYGRGAGGGQHQNQGPRPPLGGQDAQFRRNRDEWADSEIAEPVPKKPRQEFQLSPAEPACPSGSPDPREWTKQGATEGKVEEPGASSTDVMQEEGELESREMNESEPLLSQLELEELEATCLTAVPDAADEALGDPEADQINPESDPFSSGSAEGPSQEWEDEMKQILAREDRAPTPEAQVARVSELL